MVVSEMQSETKTKMEINLPKEQVAKIKKYIEEGRFKSFDDFFEQAAKLLLYSEDRKEQFNKILG